MMSGKPRPGPTNESGGCVRTDLRVRAGRHDFDRPLILGQFSGHYTVARHELLHDRALTETDYGFAVVMFKRVAGAAKEQAVRTAAERWWQELIAAGTRVFEVHATYLAVKLLPPSEQPAAVRELRDHYPEFYQSLADLIDPVFNSSYAQYMVGQTLTEVCLSPRLLHDLVTWGPDWAPMVQTHNSPDHRLNTILPVWQGALPGLADAVDTAFIAARSTGTVPSEFDPQSEASWESLTAVSPGAADDVLQNAVRDWMYEQAALMWPCNLPHEWMPARSAFAEQLKSATGLPITVVSHFDVPGVDQDRARRAWNAGRMLVETPGRLVAQRRPDADTDASEAVLWGKGPYTERFFISDAPRPAAVEDRVWTVLARQGEGPYSATSMPWGPFRQGMLMRRHLALRGAPLSLVDLVVVGLWADQGMLSGDLVDAVMELHTAGTLQFDTKRIVWYLGGDFLAWYEALLTCGSEVEAMWTVDPAERERAAGIGPQSTLGEVNARAVTQRDGPTLFAIRGPSIPGTWIRVLSAGAWEVLCPVLASDHASGRVLVMEPNRAQETYDSVSRAWEPIISSWPAL